MKSSRRVLRSWVTTTLLSLLTLAACASSDEADGVFGPTKDGGKDAALDSAGSGGSGAASGSGGSGLSSGTGGTLASGGTTATGGSGGGTCNPQTCPTPAPPAVKCCVTNNGPCGVDYQQGAGCQTPATGDI